MRALLPPANPNTMPHPAAKHIAAVGFDRRYEAAGRVTSHAICILSSDGKAIQKRQKQAQNVKRRSSPPTVGAV